MDAFETIVHALPTGVRMVARAAGPSDGPLIVLLHGFPETWRCWRRQIAPLAASGWRVLAPDQRGYGETGGPAEIEAYRIDRLCGDVAALIRLEGREEAVVVGHDWGGAVVWSFAQLFPEMSRGVIGVNTPHRPPPPAPPTAVLVKLFGPDHYMVRFQESAAHEALDADVEGFLRLVLSKPDHAPSWPPDPAIFAMTERLKHTQPGPTAIDAVDFDAYAASFREHGFERPLHWYRNIDANWALMKAMDPTIQAPALWVGAEWDAFLHPSYAEGMEAITPNLEKRIIPQCGHWTTAEAPDALIAHMQDWLTKFQGETARGVA